jgi:hypothetical protein
MLGQRERLLRTGTTHGKRMWTGARSVHVVYIRFPRQGVHQFESPRLSDMINRLPRGSFHVAN